MHESKDRNLQAKFNISLKPYEEKTYYLLFESPLTTLIINLDLIDKIDYDRWYFKNILFIALFFGGMLALATYNIFVYFATKEIAYLFYSLCIVATSFHHSAYTGVLFLFANIEYSLLVFKYSFIVVSLPMYFLGLFSKYYLETINFTRINKTINFFLLIIPISWIFFTYFSEFSKFRNLLSFIFLFYLLCIAIYLAYKKIQRSYYIIVGWFLFFLSSIFMMLSSSGTYDIFKNYPYIVEVLLFMEAILFSIALSNKITTLQNEVILLKDQKEQELQIEVAQKTEKLSKSLQEKQLLLKELSHRVKNNMQMILSLIRLQSKEISSLEFKKVLMTIEGRIGALGHLHDLLYKQDDITSIKAHDYFGLLITDLINSHHIEEEKIHFRFELKGSLLVNHAIYCGLIINELVTNTLKYAFDDQKGDITLFFEEHIDSYRLKYSDNGKGCTFEENSNSLGMLIIHTLAEDQLEGDLELNSSDGLSMNLTWSKESEND